MQKPKNKSELNSQLMFACICMLHCFRLLVQVCCLQPDHNVKQGNFVSTS